jgi:hypothetical protein
MANWSLPTLSSLYADVVSLFKDRDLDLAKGLDPAKVTITNPVTDMLRWSSAGNKWERYNGTAWVDMATTYAISISGNAATATSAATATNSTQLGGVAAASYARLDQAPVFAGGAGGSEGGEIWLKKPPSGTSIAGDVAVDIAGNLFRIFEGGGGYRGAYIDLTACGSMSKLWHNTNDGAGSGLDADLLDGQHASYFQQALVSGTNIKTLNGQSLLGSGNILPLPLTQDCHSGTFNLALNTCCTIYSGGGNLTLNLPSANLTNRGSRIELYNIHGTVGSSNTSWIKLPRVDNVPVGSINGVPEDLLIDRSVGGLTLVVAWGSATTADWTII